MRHSACADRGFPLLWLLLLILGCPWLSRGDVTYIVKRNDTLTSISRQYGINVRELANHNKITERNRIVVGQRLLIPSKNTPKNAPKKTPSKVDPLRNPALPSQLAGVSVSSRWRYIVIHHSGVGVGDVKSMDRYHRENRHMENGLAYHFVIGNGHGMEDGQIAVCNRWRQQLNGGHLASEAQNKISIGICLVGNFDRKRPTPAQLRSLEVLVRYLMARCRLGVSAVRTHQQIHVNHTRCPGKYFPTKSFVEKLKTQG